MMTKRELLDHLQRLGITQAEAALLLSVSDRTVRRWAEAPAEIPGPAEHVLRAWVRLHERGIAWRPDGLPIGEDKPEEIAQQIALYRGHAISLDSLIRRVEARGGPTVPWEVNVEAGEAILGPVWVTFYRLPNGGFSPQSYGRSDREPDFTRDRLLIEDAYVCIARATARRRGLGKS
jgi:hypothetical protein